MFNKKIQCEEQSKSRSRMGTRASQTKKNIKKNNIKKKTVEEISERLLMWHALARVNNDWELQRIAIRRCVTELLCLDLTCE